MKISAHQGRTMRVGEVEAHSWPPNKQGLTCAASFTGSSGHRRSSSGQQSGKWPPQFFCSPRAEPYVGCSTRYRKQESFYNLRNVRGSQLQETESLLLGGLSLRVERAQMSQRARSIMSNNINCSAINTTVVVSVSSVAQCFMYI